ncbi:MAG TPA: YqcC family protein [Tepidisphaeraceae bacterium]|jgi:uncharacterized protein YqcC (DUF446 family)
MQPAYELVASRIDEIEAEMRRMGVWQSQPLTPEQLNFKEAFGMDVLALEQWLQFIFIPNVRKIIATKGKFPSGSQVADQAYREWVMWGSRTDVEPLIQLLRQFDSMFGEA